MWNHTHTFLTSQKSSIYNEVCVTIKQINFILKNANMWCMPVITHSCNSHKQPHMYVFILHYVLQWPLQPTQLLYCNTVICLLNDTLSHYSNTFLPIVHAVKYDSSTVHLRPMQYYSCPHSCLCVLLGLINLLPSFLRSSLFLEPAIVFRPVSQFLCWWEGCCKVAAPANTGFS